VYDLLAAVVRHDDDLPRTVAVLDADPAGGVGDGRLALGYPCLEDLLDTRQTLGDVVARDATGVEGTHGQLRTPLTGGRGGDDAHGLADVDGLAGRQRPPVAGAADAQLRLAGQHAAHAYLVDAGRHDLVHQDRVQVGTARHDHRALGVGQVVGQG